MLAVGGVFWKLLGYRLLFNRYTLIATAVLASGGTWWMMRSAASPETFLREALLDSISDRLLSQMPASLRGRTIAVADLRGDPGGAISKGIRDRLGAQRVRIVPSEFLDRVLRQIGLAGKPIVSLEDAMRVARETGVDAVLFGEVAESHLGRRTARLKLFLRWGERSTGQTLYVPPLDVEIGNSMWTRSYWTARMLAAPPWPRILAWLGFTILLPIVASPLIRRLTAEQSNTINFAVLAGATVLDGALAFALLGFSAASAVPAILLTGAFAGAVYYNFIALEAIDEYRD